MKVPPEFWDEFRTEADDDVTLAGFIGAFAVLILALLVVFTYTLFAWSAT